MDYKRKTALNSVRCIVWNNRLKIFLLFMIPAVLNFTGCCAYSFTGASVPEHLKTIAIPVSDDRSGSAEPDLRNILTDELIRNFIEDNTLKVADRVDADAVLETVITSLSDAPAIIAAEENVQLRRITVSVQAVYRDLIKRTVIYEKTFSNYSDYSEENVENRRNAVIIAIERIAEDILLDTVSGW